MPLRVTQNLPYTVKPQHTGPLGGKELGPVIQDQKHSKSGYSLHLYLHITLVSGDRIESWLIEGPGKSWQGKSGFYCT